MRSLSKWPIGLGRLGGMRWRVEGGGVGVRAESVSVGAAYTYRRGITVSVRCVRARVCAVLVAGDLHLIKCEELKER